MLRAVPVIFIRLGCTTRRYLGEMDMKILEKRLLTRDSALAISSVSKCAFRVQQYLAALQSNDQTGSEVAAAKDALLREFALYRIEMGQSLDAAWMCDRELVESQAIERTIEDDIQAAELEISKLSQELTEQKSIRKHKEECELLAKLVNTLPAKSTVIKDIVRAEESLSKLREQSNSAEHRVKMRTTQFKFLLQSILDMKKNIEEDSEQQDLLSAADATAAQDEEEPTAAADSDGEADVEAGGRRGRDDNDGPVLKKSRSLDDPADMEEEDAQPKSDPDGLDISADADTGTVAEGIEEKMDIVEPTSS